MKQILASCKNGDAVFLKSNFTEKKNMISFLVNKDQLTNNWITESRQRHALHMSASNKAKTKYQLKNLS